MATHHFISVAGNMGVGKSTLVSLLAKEFGWTPIYEQITTSPYIDNFYQDMRRWGFHSQMFFLTQKIKQLAELKKLRSSIIQDRAIYEDAEIFAQNLYDQGNIPEEDFLVYQDLYKSVSHFIPKPTLMIYLQAEVPILIDRIQKRNRAYEKQIPVEYLEQLNQLYEGWISRFSDCKVMIVNTNKRNFIDDKEEVKKLVKQIQKVIK